MTSTRLEKLLRERIGLQAESIGTSAITTALRTRSTACGISDPEAYALHLQAHPEEFDRFIDEIVVSETWFFRDSASFDFLRRHFAERRDRTKTYKVLSLPCATGEEPYSIAMALLDAASGGPFEVRALDVSKAALEAAQRGVYRKLSFRGMSPGYERYFEETPNGRSVTQSVRQHVHFEHGNVLDPLLYTGQRFAAVFCRNLLIYLDQPARLRAFSNLERLLCDDGVLFVGNAEGSAAMDLGFVALNPDSFAFAKPAKQQAVAKRPTPSIAPRVKRPSARPPAKTLQGYPAPNPAAQRRPPAASPPANVSLDEARALADRGELAAARKSCEAYLAKTEPQADGYCLLGVLQLAAGSASEALHSFGRALYLDATHHESLVHSALIHERAGEMQEAAQFRRRAERALRKRSAS